MNTFTPNERELSFINDLRALLKQHSAIYAIHGRVHFQIDDNLLSVESLDFDLSHTTLFRDHWEVNLSKEVTASLDFSEPASQ